MSYSRLIMAAGLSITLLCSAGIALAHHGWNWAEAEQSTLSGTVVEAYVGPPHPRLEIETDDDGRWRIDLGSPGRTARANFTDDSVQVGDTVQALGNRSRDDTEKLFKAVRISIDGQVYTFYPERLDSD